MFGLFLLFVVEPVNRNAHKGNQQIRKYHKVYNTVIYGFCLTGISSGFKGRTTHGTLRLHLYRAQQEKSKHRYFIKNLHDQ